MERRRAFALIELLVAISVIALLMALLAPVLHGARRRGQSTVCQSRLRQLGLIFLTYTEDHDGRSWRETQRSLWLIDTPAHFTRHAELWLCPSAARRRVTDHDLAGDAYHAYPFVLGRRGQCGSLGFNFWVYEPMRRRVDEGWAPSRPSDGTYVHWGTPHVRRASKIPLFFDSVGGLAGPVDREGPPEHNGHKWHGFCNGMWGVCMDRHSGGTNMIFLDWSQRNVGVKEHWTFQWHRQFDTAGAWTKAGGALPEDWPRWMRRFRDY